MSSAVMRDNLQKLFNIAHMLSCRQIVDRIDKNSDGSVSATELEEWIRHVGRR